MKYVVCALLALISVRSAAQQTDPAVPTTKGTAAPSPCFSMRHSITGTVAIGFIDPYRRSYNMPEGFERSNVTGWAPTYARLEYGVSDHVTIGATLVYDQFMINYNQLYNGYNGVIRRYRNNRFRLFSGGLAAYYHFEAPAFAPRLRPFIGAGFALNNIRETAHPQGDSTIVKNQHYATAVLKAGARYFISDRFSLYGDVGYDKQSIFSLGFSCMFQRNRPANPEMIKCEEKAGEPSKQ